MKRYSKNSISFLFLWFAVFTYGEASDTLKFSKCALSVSSTPLKARVYIDNVYQGSTPLTIEGFEVKKKYELKVIKEGCKPFSESIIFYTLSKREKDIVLAEKEEDIKAVACRQAKLDAKNDISGTYWILMGCFGGVAGLGIAEVCQTSPPAVRLLGKSPEHVAYYTDCYREKAKRIQRDNATTGCILNGLGCIGPYIWALNPH